MRMLPYSPSLTRRQMLGWGTGLTLGGWLATELAAQTEAVSDFIVGPRVPDVRPEQLSSHVWMIYAQDGFPNAKNQGLMASVFFVVTQKGVVVLDSGASLQIGQMALRMIQTVTSKPVIAIFNSHYHGDHWLGNHAFVQAYGANLPIYALPHTQQQIQGLEGSTWKNLMERWTQQATLGTQVVPPNQTVVHGQIFDYGDVKLKLHHYGKAHTPSDLSIEVLGDQLTYVGDVAMDRRIANMDDGSYQGTFKYYDELIKACPNKTLWVPGHGRPSHQLLAEYRTLLAGIYEPCVVAVRANEDQATAKKRVMTDPRVIQFARQTAGFENNIGKYISLAFIEAEQAEF